MNGEKGQALPLAILALAIGTLVITPFLGHASSNLIGSRFYEEAIIRHSSCDAGIEHAIWSLTRGDLAEQFSEPGDEVTYQLGEAVNGLTTTVTVTANATGGGGGTAGEITDTILDSYNFGAGGGETPSIIPIAGDVYAIIYGDGKNDGWVKTVEIAADGTVTGTPIDSLEFDTRRGLWGDIIHISGNIYAVAYQGNGSDGFLKTIEITPDGTIADSELDTLEFETNNCNYPEIINVSGNVYAIAYQGQGSDGFVRTVQIAPDGDISSSVIDSLEFDTSNGREPDIIHISGNIFALAYRGSGSDGFLKTIEIASNGQITNTPVDTFEFNPYDCYYPSIIHISENVYAISYTGASPVNGDWWGGVLTTVEIATDGTITNSIIDEIVFDSDAGDYSEIIYIGDNAYAIAYTGNGSDGWLKTVTVDNDGTISDDIIDSLEFDNRDGAYPKIIHINGDIFAVVYTGSSQWIGILKTIEIATSGGTSAAYEILANAGDRTIHALVNTANTTVSIISWQYE